MRLWEEGYWQFQFSDFTIEGNRLSSGTPNPTGAIEDMTAEQCMAAITLTFDAFLYENVMDFTAELLGGECPFENNRGLLPNSTDSPVEACSDNDIDYCNLPLRVRPTTRNDFYYDCECYCYYYYFYYYNYY